VGQQTKKSLLSTNISLLNIFIKIKTRRSRLKSSAIQKKELLGIYQIKLGNVPVPRVKDYEPQRAAVAETNQKDAPPGSKDREDWVTAKVQEVDLMDSNNNKVGILTLRMRREIKMIGTLKVELKEVNLEPLGHSTDVHCVKCVMKLLDQVYETPTCEKSKGNSVSPTFCFSSCSKSFKVNDTNNVFDLFIEIRSCGPSSEDSKEQSCKDTILGQARLSLFDAQTKFCSPLPIFSPHHKQIGHLQIEAEMQDHENRKANV